MVIKAPKKAGPKKGEGGRPTKLTKELQDKICHSILIGCYVETAVQAAGIHKDTFYEWLKKGNKQKQGIYKDFTDAVNQSIADSEKRDVSIIDKAGQLGDWRAVAWRLERKHQTRWGYKQKIEHEGKVDVYSHLMDLSKKYDDRTDDDGESIS